MKKILIIPMILMVSLTLPAQPQQDLDKQKELNFSVSYEQVARKTKSKNELYNLAVSVDRKSIKNAERIYIRISNPETRENYLVKAIDKNVLRREVANADKAFKKIEEDKDKIQLNFGPFEKGEYYVFIKIKDDKKNMYFNRKKITL